MGGGMLLNSLIIVIIIGIIMSIYKKGKVPNKGTTQTKPFSFNRGNLLDIYTKLKETSIPNDSSFTQTDAPITDLDNWVDNDKEAKGNDTSATNIPNQMAMKIAEVEKTNLGSPFNDLEDNKKLVNAVIWSEILGKPRSKKPYYAKDK
jgi:hypothetical protein